MAVADGILIKITVALTPPAAFIKSKMHLRKFNVVRICPKSLALHHILHSHQTHHINKKRTLPTINVQRARRDGRKKRASHFMGLGGMVSHVTKPHRVRPLSMTRMPAVPAHLVRIRSTLAQCA